MLTFSLQHFGRPPHHLFQFIIHTPASVCRLNVFAELLNLSLGRYWSFIWNMLFLLPSYTVIVPESSRYCHQRRITYSLRFTCHVVWCHFTQSGLLFSDGTHKIPAPLPGHTFIVFFLILIGVSDCNGGFLSPIFRHVRKTVKSALASSCPSACMEQLGSHRIDLLEIWYLSIFPKNREEILSFFKHRTRIRGPLHVNRYTFLIISRQCFLRMRNVSDKSCRQNRNTHFLFNNFFFFENHACCEIMWTKILWKRTGHRWQCGACALHAGYVRLLMYTQVV